MSDSLRCPSSPAPPPPTQNRVCGCRGSVGVGEVKGGDTALRPSPFPASAPRAGGEGRGRRTRGSRRTVGHGPRSPGRSCWACTWPSPGQRRVGWAEVLFLLIVPNSSTALTVFSSVRYPNVGALRGGPRWALQGRAGPDVRPSSRPIRGSPPLPGCPRKQPPPRPMFLEPSHPQRGPLGEQARRWKPPSPRFPVEPVGEGLGLAT